MGGQPPPERPFARSGRTVDGDDHGAASGLVMVNIVHGSHLTPLPEQP
jgi:hypothetical protein